MIVKKSRISKRGEKLTKSIGKTMKKDKLKYSKLMNGKNAIVQVKKTLKTSPCKSMETSENGFVKVKNEKSKKVKIKKSTKKGSDTDIVKHKKELEKLKDIDPEFYEFVKENDKKLLAFNIFDDDLDTEPNDEDVVEDGGDDSPSDMDLDENDEEIESEHIPQEKLLVASDESDNEESGDDAKDDSRTVINTKVLKKWQAELQSENVSVEVIRKTIRAFNAALGNLEAQEVKSDFKVDSSAGFNGVIQLCVLYLKPAIYRFLKITQKSTNQIIHKCKRWPKIRSCLRSYLQDLAKLLSVVVGENILVVLLKHLHEIAGTMGSFPTIVKPVLKRLITLWSTSEETVKILSFLCILKITRSSSEVVLNKVVKSMYVAYIRNSKFVNVNSLPGINFMRRSLVELFSLDLTVAYQHSFLYMRQLAIHLRNALILKKKDSYQAVYNWAFINSLELWVELISNCGERSELQPLIYPLVMIIVGTIKLKATTQFFPLRFHCIRMLVKLGKSTRVFIPVLGHILESLTNEKFNKKHSTVSIKPLPFTCLLRLSKSQLAENGFRDEVMENVFGLILEYLEQYSNSVTFPDLIVPMIVNLKHYAKSCKNSNYNRKIKQLIDTSLENSKFIEDERKKANLSIKDAEQIRQWEISIRTKGTPLTAYYGCWRKSNEVKKKRQATMSADIGDYNIPTINRIRAKKAENKASNDSKDVELFPSDSEDNDGELLEEKLVDETVTKKEKKNKMRKKKNKLKESKLPEDEEEVEAGDGADCEDIIQDIDVDDW